MASLGAFLLNGNPVEVNLGNAHCVADIRALIASTVGKSADSIVIFQGGDPLGDAVCMTKIQNDGDLTVVIDPVVDELEKRKCALREYLHAVTEMQRELTKICKLLEAHFGKDGGDYMDWIDRCYWYDWKIAGMEFDLETHTLAFKDEKTWIAKLLELKRMRPESKRVTELHRSLHPALRSLHLTDHVLKCCAELLELVADENKDEKKQMFESVLVKVVNDELGTLSPWYEPDWLSGQHWHESYLEWEADEYWDEQDCPDFSVLTRQKNARHRTATQDRHTKFYKSHMKSK